MKIETPSLAHADADAEAEAEARARFVRRLVLAELLARRGEGPLAPRFGRLPLLAGVRERGREPEP